MISRPMRHLPLEFIIEFDREGNEQLSEKRRQGQLICSSHQPLRRGRRLRSCGMQLDPIAYHGRNFRMLSLLGSIDSILRSQEARTLL